jgi:hypothetical protein
VYPPRVALRNLPARHSGPSFPPIPSKFASARALRAAEFRAYAPAIEFHAQDLDRTWPG